MSNFKQYNLSELSQHISLEAVSFTSLSNRVIHYLNENLLQELLDLHYSHCIVKNQGWEENVSYGVYCFKSIEEMDQMKQFI